MRTAVSVIFIILSIALIVAVLMQERTDSSLGSISGGMYSDSYLKKNKIKSKQRILKRISAVLIAALFLVALLMNTSLI